MAVLVDFVPVASVSAPIFQFQPTFDGAIYTVTVTWNVFGQRFYIEITSLSGTLLLATPLIGSPLGYDIDLTNGYFLPARLVYRAPSRQFEVLP